MTEEQYTEIMQRRRTKTFGTMICEHCKKETPKRGAMQKFCVPCSEEADLIRKRLWVRNHPADQQKTGEKSKASIARAHEQGLRLSSEHAQSIAWDTSDPDLLWMVRFRIPFDYAISKNHIWSTTRKGVIYLQEEHRNYRDNVITICSNALKAVPIVQNKIWLDILVQKPNHKGDAINVIDGLCDALKHAIGIDDRWFAIRRLDWEIVKENPFIYIGVGQADCTNSQVCSLCGRILPFTEFTKAKHNKNGIARTCPECRKVERKGSRWLKTEKTPDEDDD